MLNRTTAPTPTQLPESRVRNEDLLAMAKNGYAHTNEVRWMAQELMFWRKGGEPGADAERWAWFRKFSHRVSYAAIEDAGEKLLLKEITVHAYFYDRGFDPDS